MKLSAVLSREMGDTSFSRKATKIVTRNAVSNCAKAIPADARHRSSVVAV